MPYEEKIFVTKEGLRTLEEKVKRLENDLAALSKEKQEALALGGDEWHDNPAFEAVELKQRMLWKELATAKEELRRAAVVEERTADGSVTIGSIVEVEFENGTVETFRLGDYTESNPTRGIISYKSPLGSALLGAKAGEAREYHLGGLTQRVIIKTVKTS